MRCRKPAVLRYMKGHYFILLFFCVIVYSSCEKVVDIDLKNAVSKVVIEGAVSNLTDTQRVLISRTVPFYDSNTFPGVSGAVVTITDEIGTVYTLRERSPGVYSARRFRGVPGRVYRLKVISEGVEYAASSAMPRQVMIDSLGLSLTTFFQNEERGIQVLYSDPPDVKNQFRFLLTVNGIKSKSAFAYNDDFNNGRIVSRELLDFDLDIKSGDIVEVEMQCIDAAMYRYWSGLDQNESRGGASTTPANPVSNISNGALGYFSAHTQQKETMVIP